MGSLALRPGDSLTIPKMALSISFCSFGFPPASDPSYGVLTFSPAGLNPAERASLSWTHDSPKKQACTLLHETVHIRQAREFGEQRLSRALNDGAAWVVGTELPAIVQSIECAWVFGWAEDELRQYTQQRVDTWDLDAEWQGFVDEYFEGHIERITEAPKN